MKIAGMNTVLNICEAPYFADPTGAKDCTEAILRALDDSAGKVSRAYKKGLAEVEALPSKGRHKYPGSTESYRENGKPLTPGPPTHGHAESKSLSVGGLT